MQFSPAVCVLTWSSVSLRRYMVLYRDTIIAEGHAASFLRVDGGSMFLQNTAVCLDDVTIQGDASHGYFI